MSSDATYPDFGCNVESYCDSEFVELERLGPGQAVEHVEMWEFFNN